LGKWIDAEIGKYSAGIMQPEPPWSLSAASEYSTGNSWSPSFSHPRDGPKNRRALEGIYGDCGATRSTFKNDFAITFPLAGTILQIGFS
jgi:hypothetical protein